ncbi:TetR/AcrR family transcriptional regulator [Gorillibacterium massiliense]|uniref:TetR/AcrR family transcriptional regulator n=1 Tax=Gorillibacterium massiliense TaxID=1280390 RepID=UPI0004AF8C55|nr:TetR/AcrR family transcriptional regulator [Gorillibacterium massiliense]
MVIKQSLRDTKKEATARAMAEAAFELARERGLDGFVVEDVVQRAGYSRRTFANYFTCKEEAVAIGATTFENTQEYDRVLADFPEDTPLLDVIYQMAKVQLTNEHIRKMHELVSLSRKYPTLEPYFLSVRHGLQTEAQESLGEMFSGRYEEVYLHLLLGAVYGAILPLVEGRLNVLLPDQAQSENPGATPFNQYLDTVFTYLRNGFYKQEHI